MESIATTPAQRKNARNAVAAGFLGWTIDAFDFFVLVFTVSAIAKDFGRSIPAIALTITASLATRPVGAFFFGLLADRFGRRLVLIANILFYSVMEILSGLAGSYEIFFILRLLYGIGMGGNWGVGASLAMESAPPKWRGVLSGLLQEGYAVGNILAATAYFLVFPHWGWRAMFFVGAAPALLTIVLCLFVEEPQAWYEARTDWATYRAAIFKNFPLFLYLIALMTMMNFISHGTQDLYPTFLQRARGFDVSTTSIISIISMTGALAGGLVFGHMSDRRGRRKSMVTAALLGVLTIPLWVLAPNKPLIVAGAFAMQFMVQGAWGIIPAHINELSPGPLRGFFPGLAYQCGVLIASSIGYVEAVLGEHFSYAASMGGLAAAVLIAGAIVIWAGPEAKGISFVRGGK
ncbi:MAG TPA: MFS transporter [Bryobacteraceae bacterium]|jgi:SHS family lactate transporter-like MFS transporter|nr:MFS transporter [Bryobacteraceae bacterium]